MERGKIVFIIPTPGLVSTLSTKLLIYIGEEVVAYSSVDITMIGIRLL